MLTLDEIAIKYETDKSSDFSWTEFKGHDYCVLYEKYFEVLRHEPIKLVELGVHKAGSIRMWDEYFDHPDAHLWGVDQDTRCFGMEKRITFHRIDQSNPRLGEVLLADHKFDIIIDDCSHKSELTLASFQMLWPLVKPGGYYIIEDLKPQPEVVKYVRQTLNRRKTTEVTFEQGRDDQICFIRKIST